nr:MAG TPA: hypothetical protein [Caudoviricetes sp.]
MTSSEIRFIINTRFGNQNKPCLYNLSGKYIVTDFRTKINSKVRKGGKICMKNMKPFEMKRG